MRLITLTLPKDLPANFDENFKELKINFIELLKIKTNKQENSDEPGKLVNFDMSLIGYSVYFHPALEDDYHGNPVVGIHLHAISLLEPSFTTTNSITKIMIDELWAIANQSSVLLETDIETLPPTDKDFVQTHAFGIKKHDFD